MIMTPSNEDREAFEEEATYLRMNLVRRPSGKYHRIHTQNAWEIWQAAFAHTKRRDGVPEGWPPTESGEAKDAAMWEVISNLGEHMEGYSHDPSLVAYVADQLGILQAAMTAEAKEGYVLVPIVQTFEMEKEGAESLLCGPCDPQDWRHATAANVWGAMVKASPEYKP